MISRRKEIYLVIFNFIIMFICYRQLFVFFDFTLNLAMYILFLILFFLYYITDLIDFRRRFLVKDFIISIFLNTICCSLYVIFYKKEEFISLFIVYTILQISLSYICHIHKKKIKNVILVNFDEKIRDVVDVIERSENYKVLGYVSKMPINTKSLYLGELSKLEKIIENKAIDMIIFLKNDYVKQNIQSLVKLKLQGINVIDYLLFLEEFVDKIDTEKIDSLWILMTDTLNNCNINIKKRGKRVFDILLSIFLLILFFPFMIFTYILVKCDIGFKYLLLNPKKIIKNPALFKQKRIGYRGQEFEIFKFRSMKIHDPTKYSKYASKNDERITKIGKFIRKTRLDELPQIINVFRGDMSFVGPRPEWNELGHQYEKEIKNYSLRYAVQPGITGWAQTMYTYGASVNDAKIKLEYDLYYVKNCSLILDIIILFKTSKIMIFRKGL